MTAMYRTSDIYIASYLLASGYEDYTIEPDGKKYFFMFTTHNTPSEYVFDVEVDQYFSNNVKIEPKKLFNAYKELKGRIFGGI